MGDAVVLQRSAPTEAPKPATASRPKGPTIVFMDEAAFNENGAEAYSNAISTRPQKLIAISSAYPGWFFDLIEPAESIPLPELA